MGSSGSQRKRTLEDEILAIKLANAVADEDIFNVYMQEEFGSCFASNNGRNDVVGKNITPPDVGRILGRGFNGEGIAKVEPSFTIVDPISCFCWDTDVKHTDWHEDAIVQASDAGDLKYDKIEYPAADLSEC